MLSHITSPKSGDVVNFTVKVRNAYLTKKDVEVKLFIDDKFADETGGSIPATSDMTFTLHWLAESGQHSYEVKLYSVDENGVKTLVGSRQGIIIVGNSTRQFAVELEAFPRELEGGGTVYFTVKAWNFASDALNVQFHVVNESGKVVYPKDGGWVSKYIPRNAKNFTLVSFDRDVFGIGNHTYTVVAKISGEEEKDSVTIKVKPVNGTLKQVGFECSDLYLSTGLDRKHHLLYKGTLICKAILYNPTSLNLVGNITDVYAINIVPKALDDNLVGEWGHTAKINIEPHSYYTIVFQRNTTSINVYTLERDLYGLTFTVELHYEFTGQFNKEFVGIASAEITQNSVQAAISGTIFIGGTAATALGFLYLLRY